MIEAREDGLCADCIKNKAVTNDGRFCKSCLRKRIREEVPFESSAPRGFGSGQRGRTGNRAPGLLGGAPPEMTEDRDDA